MILDNLTRAFKTQNWFAVALEFVIVSAGAARCDQRCAARVDARRARAHHGP